MFLYMQDFAFLVLVIRYKTNITKSHKELWIPILFMPNIS